MATSAKFQRLAREIPELGQKQLFQFGPGLAFPATVRKDRCPKLHPVCVNLEGDGLHLLSRYKSRGEPDRFPRTYLKWRDD